MIIIVAEIGVILLFFLEITMWTPPTPRGYTLFLNIMCGNINTTWGGLNSSLTVVTILIEGLLLCFLCFLIISLQ